MKIRASFHGSIRRPWEESSRELEVEEGTTVEALLLSVGYQPQEMRRLAVVVNRRRSKLSAELEPNDDVRFVLLAGGG